MNANERKPKRIDILIRLGVVALSLYFMIWKIEWQSVLQVLSHVRWEWTFLAILSFVFTLGIKIVRWKILLILADNDCSVPLRDLIAPFFVGQAMNILLPFRGGEIVRCSWLGIKNRKLIFSGALSILLEKWQDLFLLSLLFLSTSPYIAKWVRFLPVYSWGVLGFILIVFWGFVWWLQRIRAGKIRFFVPNSFRKILGREIVSLDVAQFTSGSMLKGVISLILSLFIWGCMILTNLLVMISLSLPLNITLAVVVLVFIYVALIPALVPGNLGPFHGAVVLGFTLFQIPIAVSLSYAILLHAIVTVIPLLFSGWVIFVERWGK